MSEQNFPATRRWKRYRVDLRVRVIFKNGAVNHSAAARGQDVSEGGMALFVPLELNETDVVTVEFTLPYSRLPLSIKAGVRNRTGFRYGVEFLNVSEQGRQEIRRLCEAMLLLET